MTWTTTPASPKWFSIGAGGETSRFAKSAVFDKDCPAGSYVFGTVHFMERDTPLANYFAKILDIIGIIFIGLAVGAVVGIGVGFSLAGLQGAVGGGVLIVALVAVIGFFAGGLFELLRPAENDAHLGGIRIVVGPIAATPAKGSGEAWPLTMTPSGKLEVVDVHGADLVTYASSHVDGGTSAGHLYETSLRLSTN